MRGSILALLASTAALCHAQTSIEYDEPVAPTTNIITEKRIQCTTYYAASKVSHVQRNTVDITSKYDYTIYPYTYVISTTTASSCFSSYGPPVASSVAANVNVAVVSEYPAEVYCTKSVEIVKEVYVTAPVSTYTEYYEVYPTNLPDPEGVQWAVYPNTEGADADSTYSTFENSVFTNSTPYYYGVTDAIGGFSGTASSTSGYTPFYDSPLAFDESYFVLNHRWYLHAPQSGIYTVSVPTVDDIALLYVGPNAFSNYSRASANQTFTSSGASSTYTFSTTAGSYVPMRLFYAQATGAYSLTFSLTAPDGTVLIDPSSTASTSVIQYGCGGYDSPAPPFPEFSYEEYNDYYEYLEEYEESYGADV